MDTKIHQFIQELSLTATDLHDILLSMRDIVYQTYPDAEERMMYGGILFSFEGQDFGGLFAYSKHVSFEFSQGFRMNDRNHRLEGSGKYRRHLKVKHIDDIPIKDVAFFIGQAVTPPEVTP